MDVEAFLSERIRAVPDFPSRSVTELAIDLLPLRATPVVSPPEHIVIAANQAARNPVIPTIRGLPEFREAIADSLASELGWHPSPDSDVVVTNGAMQGIIASLVALIDPGDEVLLPSPCFFYHHVLLLIGGVPVQIASDPRQAYRPDWDALAAAVTPRTRMIIITTPGNPTGYVMEEEDTDELARLADRCGLLVLCDESYDVLVYDGGVHRSPLRAPALRERTILIKSMTKSYALGHWRIGYSVAPPRLASAIAQTVGWMTLGVSHPSQIVGQAALRGPRDWLPTLIRQYQTNRDRVCDEVSGIDAFACHVPQGSGFIWLNVQPLGMPSTVSATRLAYELAVPAVAGDYFGTPGFVRIPFGGPSTAIEDLCKRLRIAGEWSSTQAVR